MLKTKIYASIAARAVVLFVMFVGLVIAFPVYVLCLIGEGYLSMVNNYAANTRKIVEGYDKILSDEKK